MADSTILAVLDRRDALMKMQQEMYITAVSNINMRYRELLTNDFGTTLVCNCAGDLAGEIVRRYFNTADYYITADQMVRRILSFSYEDDYDPLLDNENARKSAYNISDSPHFKSFLQIVEQQNQSAQRKLFEKEQRISKNGKKYSQYKDHKMIVDGKENYREKHGDSADELTGARAEEEFRLEVDHVQAAATAMYNSRYLRDETVQQELKKFYNSPDNFQMLTKSANGSKGDVRVYSDGKRLYSANEVAAQKKQRPAEEFEDVTYKASAQQVAKAVCDRWEGTKRESTKENLQKSGHLGPDGKVPAKVRKELEANLRHSMNEESKFMLKNMSYAVVVKDAGMETVQAFSKIVIGQVIYYILPPTLFETQRIIRKKGMTIDKFLKEIERAGKRVVNYVQSKLGEIFKNIAVNSLHKFIKAFFDLVISMLKETVRRLVKLAKSLILSLVQSIKVLTDKRATPAEKADAVTKIFAAAITNVLLEVLFEMIEDALALNTYITEPLQIIVSIIATNLVMLILQKADLFDVQYGLLVANMEQIFQEERQVYLEESERAFEEAQAEMTLHMDRIRNNMTQMENSIKALDLYGDNVEPMLDEFNKLYQIGIDFCQEWHDFLTLQIPSEVEK